MKEIGRRLAVDAYQIRSSSAGDAANEKLRQPILRLFSKTTTTYPHSPILDPLTIWDSPNSFSETTSPKKGAPCPPPALARWLEAVLGERVKSPCIFSTAMLAAGRHS
jgi:hypothetical protein